MSDLELAEILSAFRPLKNVHYCTYLFEEFVNEEKKKHIVASTLLKTVFFKI